MEVTLPGFDFAIVAYVALAQVIVASIIAIILRHTTKLSWVDILKGAVLFLIISAVVTSFAMSYIVGVYDNEVRVSALEALGYSYVKVDGNVWLGVKDEAFYRGIFTQQLQGSEVWYVEVLPVGGP